MNKKNILITGGAGFIGSNLARKLLKLGHSVTVLDNLSPQIHGSDPKGSPLFLAIKDRVNFIKGDITNRDHLRKALRHQDIVVHLAAETGTGQSMYAIKRYTDVNVGGTALLLELIANSKTDVRKVVVASSRAIYGEGKYRCPTHGNIYPGSRAVEAMQKGDFEVHCPLCNSVSALLPTDEESMVRPASIYGITKLNQEQMVLTMGQALGFSAIAFRYQNVYGSGQSLSNPYTGILSIFSTRIRNMNPLNIFEDGKESRDFVYIDDAVAATVAGIEHEKTIVSSFNVGSGVATDVSTLAKLLMKKLGIEVPVEVTGRFRAGDIRHNLADLSRIQAVFGYKPQTTITDGLQNFVDWVKQEEVGLDQFDQSIAELKARGLYK